MSQEKAPPQQLKDQQFMRQVLELARQALGRTSPNPLVGALVVTDDDRIVGQGHHTRAGRPHAEVIAIEEAGELCRGATLYTNLEPCCHQGRTPACVDSIIPAGIRRVVIAHPDPNPLVDCGGIQRLRDAGIEVVEGVLETEARELNAPYLKYIIHELPYVTVKMAMSLDGKIATASGESKWITCDESRRRVHELRNQTDAIMVGIGTVLADDPQLNVRIETPDIRHPQKVIVDSKGRVPNRCRTITTDPRTIVAVASKASPSRVKALESAGARVEIIDGSAVKVDVTRLMYRLAELEIMNVLIEGGGGLAASLFEAGLVDRVVCFVAPLIIGGAEAPSPVGGRGVAQLSEAHYLTDVTYEQSGRDLMISGKVEDNGAPIDTLNLKR
jgi:diaminohydroxyphosphoribosylaminopyrimidine deaminase/5-amino-6-(5-phosphoribosylamino)uracil reductase